MTTPIAKLVIIQMLFVPFLTAQNSILTNQITLRLQKSHRDHTLSNVYFPNQQDGLAIQFTGKGSYKERWHTYAFDMDLNLVEETDSLKNQEKGSVYGVYSPLTVTVYQDWKGKIIASQKSMNFGASGGKMRSKELEIEGEQGERLHLYYQTPNYATKDIYLIVGIKGLKKSKSKQQHARVFQIIRVKKDLSIEYLQKIRFKFNMGISFSKILSYESNTDLAAGLLCLVFSPVRSWFAGSNQSRLPGDLRLLLINKEGEIVTDIPFKTKVSGWKMEDFIFSPDGKSIYFFGPAQRGFYVNEVASTLTNLYTLRSPKNSKWDYYQIMKIHNDQLSWIEDTSLKEFKRKAISPPSQKKTPLYKGKNFQIQLTHATSEGSVFIGGQLVDLGEKFDEQEEIIIEKNKYNDLLLFQFGNRGALEAQYGIKRHQQKKQIKYKPIVQSLILSPDESKLFWIYQDIYHFTLKESHPIGNRELNEKNYRYTLLSQIDLTTNQIGDFQTLGKGPKGQQMYFSHPTVPWVLSKNGGELLFLGNDQSTEELWVGKLNLEK